MTPLKLAPKDFENDLLEAANRCPSLTMSRYGVQVSLMNGEWRPVPSLPDMEGIIAPTGSQFIIEAKTCVKSAFALDPKTIKPRQVKHMIERSRYGATCFLVVHFAERHGKTFHEPAETVAIPVNDRHAFWQSFLDAAAESKRTKAAFISPGSINREMASRIGRRVEWTCPKGSRKHLPDLAALLGISEPSLF